jgi:hypothetical protein
MEVVESVTIRRVANGWVVQSGKALGDFLHVAVTPTALAEYVSGWAEAHTTKPANGKGGE